MDIEVAIYEEDLNCPKCGDTIDDWTCDCRYANGVSTEYSYTCSECGHSGHFYTVEIASYIE